jgi:hypothetical protein
MSRILPHEGRFLETILKAEEGMASRGYRLVANASGRFGKSARQALRPGCEELRCTDREEMPEMEARNPDPKSPWWSAERRASLR